MVFTKTSDREITIITTIQHERHNEMKFCLSPTHTRKKCIVLLFIRYDALALLLYVLICAVCVGRRLVYVCRKDGTVLY